MRWAIALAGLGLAACWDDGAVRAYRAVDIDPYLGEAVMGDPASPVEIIEYASTTCGHCRAFHLSVLPQLKASYIDTGKAHLVYRVLPTPPPQTAMAGAAIARCAGEETFFEVIEDLYQRQDRLVGASRQPGRLQRMLIELGGRHGLSPDEVATCIDDKTLNAYLISVARDAPEHVTGTPSFMVQGEPVEDKTFEALAAAIEAELAASRP